MCFSDSWQCLEKKQRTTVHATKKVICHIFFGSVPQKVLMQLPIWASKWYQNRFFNPKKIRQANPFPSRRSYFLTILSKFFLIKSQVRSRPYMCDPTPEIACNISCVLILDSSSEYSRILKSVTKMEETKIVIGHFISNSFHSSVKVTLASRLFLSNVKGTTFRAQDVSPISVFNLFLFKTEAS